MFTVSQADLKFLQVDVITLQEKNTNQWQAWR